MIKAYCKPRIKVGTEWVVKGQTCEQVALLSKSKLSSSLTVQATNAVGGIGRAIYDRVFKWLIEKCNVSEKI